MSQLSFVNTIRIIFAIFFITLFQCSFAQLRADFSLDKTGGCSPLTVSFSNRSTGASSSASYQWDFGNGNSSVLQNPGAIYKDEKTYTVTLTVTDGAQTASKTATVTVYKKPSASFNVDAAKVCIPSSAGFTSTSSAGDGYIANYYWDFGDGTTQQGYGTNMSHSYNYVQKPTVSLTVTNNYGCASSVTKTEAVEILPQMMPAFAPDKTLYCEITDLVSFSNTSTGPGTLQYNWDFGDGTNSNQKTPTHVYNKKGLYNVRMTLTNTDGCSASTNYGINVAYFNTDFSNRPLCRELTFNSSSYLYPSNSVWDYGEGLRDNNYYGRHTYTAAGNYTVKLINTYNGICKDSISKVIDVRDLVNFNSDFTVPSLLCKQSGNSFTPSATTQPSNSIWEFGDGYTGGWYGTQYHQYAQAGNYTVKLTNTFGTCKEIVTKNIIVNDLPNPQGFVADMGEICGAPVTVQFKDTTAGAVRWQWGNNYPYDFTSTSQNPSYRYISDGTYYVSLQVWNAAGCSQSTNRTIQIYRPNVSITLLQSTSPRGTNYDCDSITVRLGTSANQPLVAYEWNFGDGTTSTLATPQHSYNVEGIYPVTLTYTTEAGCKGTTTYNVRVYGKPKADFRYSVPCGNSLDLQFNDASNYSDNWEWRFGDGGSGYNNITTHRYPDTGKYTTRYIIHIGHCSDTIYKEVYANWLPASVSLFPGQNTCTGTRGDVTFTQQSIRAQGLLWDFGDGTTMPYDTSVHTLTHTYARTGTYRVTITGTYNGCFYSSSVTVRVLLKQSPTLTANKTEICANDNVNVQINNVETNPFASSSQYYQYYTEKFIYDDGRTFTGNGVYSNWNYTNYSSTLQGFTDGGTKMRAVINSSSGCSDTSNYINLKVNGPIAGYKVTTDNVCYKTDAIVFVDTSRSVTSTPITSWQWNFGDGYQTLQKGGIVSHMYTNPGTYYVTLTVTDATGCSATSRGQYVNVKGPKANFSMSGLYVPTVPLNTNVSFYNSTYGNSYPVNYLWKFGDGVTSTNYSDNHTYTQPGENTVQLIATDPSINCSDTATKIITVKDFNTAFAYSQQYLTNSSCPPVLVRIDNLSVGAYKVTWDFGDGTTADNQFYPSHTYYKPGTFKITLYTYGYNGLTGTYIDSITIKQPSAIISADVLTGCSSQTVSFASQTQNAATYHWDFGDGNLLAAPGADQLHKYTSGGLYTPKLIVKSDNGCAGITELSQKIIIDSLKIAIKGIPAYICDAGTINFKPDVFSIAETLAGQTLSYQWDFGTGNANDIATTKNASFAYSKPGKYIVRFKVTSPYGCVKETTEEIVIHQRAVGSITAPAELCEKGQVIFKATADQPNVEWSWNFDNGNTAIVQNPQAQTFNTARAYNVQLIVKHDGCYDTSIHQLVVHPNPVVGLTTKKEILCLSKSVSLQASGGTTYSWSPATALNNNVVSNPIASPVTNITYVVNVGNQFGCIAKDSVAITVIQPLTLKAVTDTFVCAGSNVQLKGSGADMYKWINNTSGLNNTSIANPLATPLANTQYTLVGYDKYGCFTDTARVNIAVQPLPTVNAGADVEILANTPYQLQATGSSDIKQWNWSPPEYLSCANCAAPITTPKAQMNYVVTVKNQYGCAAVDTVRITLQCSQDYVFIPNTFTPNRDGKNDMFYVKGRGVGFIKSMRIYSRWGDLVFEKTNFAIDDRAAGWNGFYKGQLVPIGSYVYFVELACDGGELFSRKGTITVVY